MDGPIAGREFTHPQAVVKKLKPGLTPDAANHIDETNEANWVTVGPRWVIVTPRGSREFFRGQQVAAEVTHQVDMRNDEISRTYTTGMRIFWNGQRLNIAGPLYDVGARKVRLRCEAIEVK